jgi:phage tail-like protein
MDANGQRFWMLAEGAHWWDDPAVQWDGARRSLRLASRRPARPRPIPEGKDANDATAREAMLRVERVPGARDAYGTSARWDAESKRVVATGALEGEVPVLALWKRDLDATDIALGYDGVLYAVADGAVTMHDRRGRMKDERVRRTGFHAWRVACDPAGGAWVLDRKHCRLARTEGQLWPDRPFVDYAPGTFRPDPENPRPPRLRVIEGAEWEAETVAIACSPGGRVAILTWGENDGRGLLRILLPDGTLSDPLHLAGAHYPHALAWLSDHRVAVMVTADREAPAYPVPADESLAERTGAERTVEQAGDIHPLRGVDEGPFLHTVTLPPHYPTLGGSKPLHALSLPGFAPRGVAMNRLFLDSTEVGTTWHRLYVEAAIPPRCGMVLYLAATETPSAPIWPTKGEASHWHAHRFGDAAVFGGGDGQTPRAAWVAGGTEVPYARPMLAAEEQRDRAGLWTVLVQRPGKTVRALRGRYLWVRAELIGDGRASPELAAVRAYGARFSYRDQYLPELYRETVFGQDAEATAFRSTPADFLDRFLGNFEGVLTGIEDRIAHAYLATDPRTAPPQALEWLSEWIGFSFDAGVSADRRREMLRAAPELARRRGTVDGLRLALELATGGMVTGGEIVVLEDWKLRRTFATILGADLADEEDPLTAGIAVSGNSYMGDTLFLGDEWRREFLALYDASLVVSAYEEAVIRDFFERMAHRVTVLVHREVEEPDFALIRRVVERELPAHVVSRVLAAPAPLMVGVSSLIGVDTYLATKRGTTPVRVDRSRIGVRDHLVSPASLDPRLEGGSAHVAAPPGAPVARFDPPAQPALPDRPLLLDGTPSSASQGNWLEEYRWSRNG